MSRSCHKQAKAISHFNKGIGTFVEGGIKFMMIDGVKRRFVKVNNRWKLKSE